MLCRANGNCFSRLLAVVLALALSDTCGTDVYHNHFAVHIPDGSRDAGKVQRVADRHGFVNRGQIGSLEDHFLFEEHSIRKRDTSKSGTHHRLLHQDPDVHWFEQQRELIRVKRDSSEEESHLAIPDPMFQQQWYLHHGASDGSDMNVIPVWQMGFTGKGVVVTILDDGIQYNHPDLKKNYDSRASSDINDDDDDPMPQDNNDNKHGTRCAGEVAAEAFNDICGVGVAFNASIGGVRMLDGPVNDAVEATALSLNPNHVDIYSASWGPEDDGKTVDGPGPLAKKAFLNGIKSGRGGKGSIYVWASGNGGRKTDNCNCDGYTNSIFTLSISSATQGGRKPWYLEECSSTLATTYSSGTPSHDASITTVDQDARLRPGKICTSSHTGTSASAPLAAAICALALEANSALTWRDMQHLVVLTSKALPLMLESGWRENGVGRKFSHKFGYGLMDAEAMVKLAKVWRGSGQQYLCETRTIKEMARIPRGHEKQGTTVSTTTTGCAGTAKAVQFLEHVQCKISLEYQPRGSLHITLTSPAGTKSSLLLPRPRDRTSTSFNNWPFLSVHFWGEQANGTWTLEIVAADDNGAKKTGSGGILKEWKLFFYGTQSNPAEGLTSQVQDGKDNHVHEEKIKEDSDGDAAINATHEHTEGDDLLIYQLIQQYSTIGDDDCNMQCLDGCSGGGGPDQCHQCKNLKFSSVCVEHCPNATFATVDNTCQRCHPLCSECFGGLSSQCLACIPGHILMEDTSRCVQTCPNGYRLQQATGNCIPCPSNCAECDTITGVTGICTVCANGLYLLAEDDACVASCPPGYFGNPETSRCDQCHKACATCIGPRDTQCSLCQSGTFFYERKCVAQCPEGSYADGVIRECVPCRPGCARCDKDECLECHSDWTLNPVVKVCLPNDNEGCAHEGSLSFFRSHQGTCHKCDDTCQTCNGSRSDNCLSCLQGHFLHIATCVDECPEMTFETVDKECRHCSHACSKCKNLRVCSECHRGYVLSTDGDRCVANCESGQFRAANRCLRCHGTCRTCRGTGAYHCLSCVPGLYLTTSGDCVIHCPAGSYQSDSPSRTCESCHLSCSTCTGVGPDKCSSCHEGSKLVGDRCLNCNDGQFFALPSSRCENCHPSCAICTGQEPEDCLSCQASLSFDPWNRTCVPCCSSSYGGQMCCECDDLRVGGDGGRCRSPSRSQTRQFFMSTRWMASPVPIFALVILSFFLAFATFLLANAIRHRKVSAGRRRWKRRAENGSHVSGSNGYSRIKTSEDDSDEHWDDLDDDVECIDLDTMDTRQQGVKAL